MENFIVSFRKYRPATFASVVGQAHITDTLKNAIKTNHLAQAFLFCGPRGVGKTTCARILAKTINCQNLSPQTEACNTCESCLSFNRGTSLNIHELDAASNNSVDDIRNLIEQVRYGPQGGKYKIYIIDEVHMLSTQAFNAFLKTLEEPPPYAIFILATTERHKILPTILSRCQIFDFNRIQVADITKQLIHICDQEGHSYETDGLHIIAQKADGALRDALSILDQIVSFSNGILSLKNVLENLNIIDYDYYFKVTELLYAENMVETLLLFDEVLIKGFDGLNFISGLAGHFRNLLMVKDQRTVKLLEVSEGIQQRYLAQSATIDAGFLLTALNLCNQFEIGYKTARNQRLHIELAIMKMAYLKAAIQFSWSDFEKKKPNELKPINHGVATPKPVNQLKTLQQLKTLKPTSKPAEEEPKLIEVGSTENINNNFDLESLTQSWRNFGETLKATKAYEATLVLQHLPQNLNNASFEVHVAGNFQVQVFNQLRTPLLNALRQNLQNYLIDFKAIVNKDLVFEEPIVQSGVTILDKMMANNPILALLKSKFEAELE